MNFQSINSISINKYTNNVIIGNVVPISAFNNVINKKGFLKSYHQIAIKYCECVIKEDHNCTYNIDFAIFVSHYGRLQNDFGTLHNDFGTLQNDFGTLQNENGTSQNDFGTLQNDFGTSHNDFGTSQNENGTSQNENGRLQNDSRTSQKLE